MEEISSKCYHHRQNYLIKHAIAQRKCADPFKLYQKPSKGMTKLIQTFISKFLYFTCGNFHSWNKIAQNSNPGNWIIYKKNILNMSKGEGMIASLLLPSIV